MHAPRPVILSPLLLVLAACGSTDAHRSASPAQTQAPNASGASGASGTPAAQAQAARATPSAATLPWQGPSADDWLSWRGPHQDAHADATGLPDQVDPAHPLWSVPLSGRGTPVVAGGRVYTMGYVGEGPTLREKIVCLAERGGTILW